MPGKFDLVLQKAEQALAAGTDKDSVEEQVLAYLAQKGAGNFRSLEEVQRANIPGVEETDTGWKGLGRAAIQGATFTLGDELRGVGAALTPGGEGGMGLDAYRAAQQRSLGRVEEVRRQRPVASAVAEGAGAILPSLALTRGASMLPIVQRGLASTRALPRVNPFAAGGPTGSLGRGGTMGLLAAAEGGAYGALSADKGKRLEGAGRGATIGGAIGAPMGLLPIANRAVRSLGQGGRRPVHAAEMIDVARRGGTEGLPARSPGLLKSADEALEPLSRRESTQRRILEQRVEDARGNYTRLEELYPTGWSKVETGNRQANIQLAKKLKEILKDPEVGVVFGGRVTPRLQNVDAKTLQSLRNTLETTVSPASIRNLSYEEVSMLRRNLRELANNPNKVRAVGFSDEVTDLMEKTFGTKVKEADRAFAKASQARDAFNIGTGVDNEFIGLNIRNPGFFTKERLNSADGLREAVRKLRDDVRLKNISSREKDVIEGQLKDGILSDYFRKLGNMDENTANKLLSNIDSRWLRQFFDDGAKGERAFRKALREAKSATPFWRKHKLITAGLGIAALASGGRAIFGGGGPAGLLEILGP